MEPTSVSDEHHAPLSDELARLLGTVQQWTRENLPPAAEGAATCEWCPLCQFVAVLRGERPDVTERVAEAGTAVASAIRGVLDVAMSARPSASDAGGAGPGVERIDLDDSTEEEAGRDAGSGAGTEP
jgi:hypothetical protein